jgi:glycerate kinase
MRVVIAPDKFKGSLTASNAAQAMARGVRSVLSSVEIDEVPMADGGEGIVEALVTATGGTFHTIEATGPLGKPVQATFGTLGDGRTAVVEMATASGLVLVPDDQRDPLSTTTRGTGELLLAAVAKGARRLIVGIGGSATNDGGAGLAQALGFRLLDADGQEIETGGGPLGRLDRIERGDEESGLADVEIAVACDVTNPLCGPDGASAVYGPQKGATPAMVAELDRNLANLARVVARDLGVSIADVPGAGAAGGLGAGLLAFAGGRLERGVDLVIDAVGLKDRLQDADLCLTGEGSLDAQSAFGKTAVGVSRLARSVGCPTVALVGSIGDGAEKAIDEGINAYFSICPGPISLETAVARAAPLLEQAAAQAFRCFLAGTRSRNQGKDRS